MVDVQPSAAQAAAAELLGGDKPALATVPAAGRRGKKDNGASDAPKKSKKKLVIISVVVLLLVAFEAKGKLLKPHYGPGHPAPPGVVFALGSNPITTNLSDGHLIQIGVSLQLTRAANSKEVNNDDSALTNITIRDLSAYTYSGLLGEPAKAQLAAALLGSYQRVLGTSEGGQQVSGVYFTTFVVQ